MGLIAPAGTAGLVVAVLALGAVAGRLPMEKTLAAGAALAGAGVLAAGFAPTFGALLAALLLRSVATGAFRSLDRPILGHLYPEGRGRAFNLYDLAWALGATLGPAVAVAATALGEWRLAYTALGACFLPVAGSL